MAADPDPSSPDAPAGAAPGDAPVSSEKTAAPTRKPESPEGNIKETIESILVAFILAFVFRAFVVEAFVIPTGSMAPTLMGAHMRYHCPDCGYQWTVNFSVGNNGDDTNIPSRYQTTNGDRDVPYPLHCPNCGYALTRADEGDADNTLTNPPVHYGDRILVLKYLYRFQPPQRWDVVVFKAPVNARVDEPLYSQNYIKRLVGNPGETIMILDGDIYVGPSGADPLRDPELFNIQRKPWVAQEALWRNVYDNDYLPHLPADKRVRSADTSFRGEYGLHDVGRRWQQPWTAVGTGWQIPSDGRTRLFTFANPTGTGELHFEHKANPDTFALFDHIAYDEMAEQEKQWARTPNPVGDLKLDLYYTRQSGDGPFNINLTKGDDAFTAEVTPGKVRLLRSHAGDPPTVEAQVDVADLRSSEPVRLEFYNVDYRVGLRVNGREVLATNDQQYAPDVRHLLDQRDEKQPVPGVRVTASNQTCRVEHLKLSRDVFYLNRHTWPRAEQPQSMWGDPERPITLGPEEYFVLGDNSVISGDARLWRDPVDLPDEDLEVQSGRVPGRFLLGKAFFVYWPAGYRPWSNAPGLVPNFGDMRFIH